MLLYTIGHSNRPIADFLALLAENNIRHIADVRRFPGSRRHPQFGAEALAAALQGSVSFFRSGKTGTDPVPPHPIGYTHFPALGGRRSKRNPASPNSAWRVAAFAAYADYMLTADFATAAADLESIARQSPTAIMCAEALPWQCHRRLIADHFLAQGWQVLDIIGPHNTKPHELPDFAAVVDGHVTYPGNPRPLFDA
jgi:uncharacterized protein (DUF488 family)